MDDLGLPTYWEPEKREVSSNEGISKSPWLSVFGCFWSVVRSYDDWMMTGVPKF